MGKYTIRTIRGWEDSYHPAEACNMSRRQIEDIAEEMSIAYNYHPDTDLEEFMQGLGGEVDRLDFDATGVESSLFVHSDGSFLILLPDYRIGFRSRVTILHEFAHFVLHSNKGNIPTVAPRLGLCRMEYEANWFALSFLMPKGLFKEKAKKYRNGLMSLAAYFKLPTRFIKIRLESL